MASPQQGSSARRWFATASVIGAIAAAAGLVPVASAGAAEPTNMVLVWN